MQEHKEIRVCKKCLLMDVDGKAYSEKIGRILQMTEPDRMVATDLYEKRLKVCRSCEKLVSAGAELGTCFACGCFVELRAAMKENRCPYKYW